MSFATDKTNPFYRTYCDGIRDSLALFSPSSSFQILFPSAMVFRAADTFKNK